MVWLTLLLQLMGLVIIVWAILASSAEPVGQEGRLLVLFAAAIVLLILLQLVPLPPGVWTALPGRGLVADGLKSLSLEPGWQPLSLAPYDTITAGLTLIPPIALLLSIVWLRAYTNTGLALALLLGAILGLLLGMLQVSDASASGRYYIQPQYALNGASGFFANPNHMATLLLATLPFLAALLSTGLKRTPKSAAVRHGLVVIVIAGTLLIAFGLFFNKSLAGLGLAVPVALLSMLIVVKIPVWIGRSVAWVSLIALAGFLALLVSPINKSLDHDNTVSVSTRHAFIVTGTAVARDYFPFGSGIGTFQRVYRMEENRRSLDPTAFVNHAHNDYLELIIETGVIGAFMLIAFLVWLGTKCVQLTRNSDRDSYAIAGAIATVTILIHSLVDFPLRTNAIAATFATAIAVLVMASQRIGSENVIRPTRHVKVA